MVTTSNYPKYNVNAKVWGFQVIKRSLNFFLPIFASAKCLQDDQSMTGSDWHCTPVTAHWQHSDWHWTAPTSLLDFLSKNLEMTKCEKVQKVNSKIYFYRNSRRQQSNWHCTANSLVKKVQKIKFRIYVPKFSLAAQCLAMDKN